MKKALITGITGQDGSYLAELLLGKNYQVYGIIRRSSSFNTGRIDHIYDHPNLELIYGDLTDQSNLTNILCKVNPDEVYNLGGQSHVQVSFQQPCYTADVNALGTLRLLEAIRIVNSKIKFYQAGSSEMFGGFAHEILQNETTPFYPQSPYGCAKVFSHLQVINYREGYGMFCCNGILFNHESPRRGETFVTRKITRAATRIKENLQNELYLGDIRVSRDWGFAEDYVKAMWLMLQQNYPDDYVIATGEAHTVIELIQFVFDYLELNWQAHVFSDMDKYRRPNTVSILCGDASKAKYKLKWQPKINFKQLITMMIEADWKLAKQERLIKESQK